MAEECSQCEDPGTVRCSCKAVYCPDCFSFHTQKKPSHHEVRPSKLAAITNRVFEGARDMYDNLKSMTEIFRRDEATKWFGLVMPEESDSEDESESPRIVETLRFEELVESSLRQSTSDAKRQRPRIVSFVGETGAGKSTLIRFLIQSSSHQDSQDLDAPVLGSDSGHSANKSTTGEVNLYSDPGTFGTESPVFFADCEGLSGGEPIASEHQSAWFKHGISYPIASTGDQLLDRKTATENIYPRFLYMFSDVVCMVTGNPRRHSDLALKVLGWAKAGAQKAINQDSLPALVIIINAASIMRPDPRWLSDPDAATEAFFETVAGEISKNRGLQALAEEGGVDSMRALFARYFSSVHVSYVPLRGYGPHGDDEVVAKQVERLQHRILSDSARVKDAQAQSWRRLDAKLMLMEFRFAFEHITSGKPEPLDFSLIRQHGKTTESAGDRVASFLKLCLTGKVEANFQYASNFLALALVRNALRAANISLCNPAYVYPETMQTACRKAVEEFLDSDQPCAFVDEKSGSSCVNTKIGHAKGHQGASGIFLADGSFVDGGFDAPRFLTSIEASIKSIIESIAGMGHAAATAHLIQQHRDLLQEAPRASETASENEKSEKPIALAKPAAAPPHVDPSSTLDCSCSLCIFGRPEYELPCGHPICEFCLADFSEKGKVEPEHVAVHQQCMYGPRPFEAPYKAPVRPQFSGIRMLSLDGGGVRGVIQLATLRRIENLIGLDLPIGQFFDLIVGTGTGGMIALGLGKEGQSAAQCTKTLEQVLKDSFYRSLLYRGWSYAWSFFRYTSPRYSSTAMENSLRNAFKPSRLFGLGDISQPCSSSLPRVAVTTTVGGNSWLAANYNRGDNKRYLSSTISTYEAARATSATPLYLDPFISPADKSTCYDGGLGGTNTSALALKESKEIWGPDAKLDLLLSLGPGIGAFPAPVPDWFPSSSEHLVSSVTDMLESLNGEAAWDRFATTANSTVRQRVRRLNPVFDDWETEPGFDDVGRMKQLALDAGKAQFDFPTMDAAPPAFATPYDDALLATADQLRAGLFYFHITRVVLADARGSVVCEGAVRCRLALPEQKEGFAKLMAMTKALVLVDSNGERKIEVGEVVEGGEAGWEMPVALTGTLGRRTGPIRVDVLFEGERQVAVSGFPVTVEELRRQYSDRE